jgi:prefoldin alpha subunit
MAAAFNIKKDYKGNTVPDDQSIKKIEQYEELLNEKLRAELEALQEERDTLNEKQANWMQLRLNSQQLIDQKQKTLKTMVDLGGGGFYMQAKVPDTSSIMVSVGLGFHAEMTLAEAVELCTRREFYYKTAAKALTEQIARKKARIKLVAAAIDEVQQKGTMAKATMQID